MSLQNKFFFSYPPKNFYDDMKWHDSPFSIPPIEHQINYCERPSLLRLLTKNDRNLQHQANTVFVISIAVDIGIQRILAS